MLEVGTVSYGAGALAFLFLTLLLLSNWRGRVQGGVLVTAAGVSALWCAVLALQASGMEVPSAVSFAAELLRDGAWLAFLVRLLAGGDGRAIPLLTRYGVHLLWLAVLINGLLRPFPFVTDTPLGAAGNRFLMGALMIALTGLILVEQVFRNARPDRRWALKYLCLGVGGLFAYDLYLYSHGTLFRQLDGDLWNARGAINALVVPLITVSAARNPDWSLDIFVSRRIVFYTTSLIGAGVYLLAMAVGGYYIRIYGGSWGTVAQAIFLFGAVLILLMMMFSGQVRARLRVFLSKHFYNYKYDYREEWLRLTRLLSSSEEDMALQERAILALAQIVESPGGGLWIRDEQGGFRPAAGWNMSVPEGCIVAPDSALTRFLLSEQWVIDLDELSDVPERYGELRMPDWLGELPRAWLIVPLMQAEALFGFIVLGQPRARQKLNWEDIDLLKAVGRHVAGFLAQHEAAGLLAEAQQFQAYNRLTAFIMHDLKNLIAQQSLVVKNAARHKDKPEFIEDAIATVENSVRRMNRLLEQLGRGDQGQVSRCRIAAICREAVEKCRDRQPVPELAVADADIEVQVERERMTMVMTHLIRNAQDATPADGTVRVSLQRDGAQALIEVRDSGCGMDARFVRERLFRPFDSTKGSKGMGIGAYQARECVRMAAGEVEVRSAPGEGTRFLIRLPALTPPERRGELQRAEVER